MDRRERVIAEQERVSYSESQDMTKEYDPNISLEEIQRQWISKALIHHNGNIVATSQSLGISRTKLYRWVRTMEPGEMNGEQKR